MERDTILPRGYQPCFDFNSHAHVERDAEAVFHVVHNSHFNSHAHVERDQIMYCFKLNSSISTHTLTWSVTLDDPVWVKIIKDFNSHAHVERDSDKEIVNMMKEHFNSHAHVERDIIQTQLSEAQ